jgi:hypothetical protein
MIMEKIAVPEGLFDGQLKKRLETLSKFKMKGINRTENGWINLHVHTNESFSAFRSPAEAVWHASNQNIEYFGINDHYTVDGYAEFRSACKIMKLKATFSIEAIAMDKEKHKNKRRFNDPDNPGRIYIIGKGVSCDLENGSREQSVLLTMRESIRKRNKRIAEKLNRYAEDKGHSLNFSYSDVRSLTPRGNTTERHVVQAFCEKINSLYKNKDVQFDIYKRLLDCEIDENTLADSSELQTLVRAKLIKTGMSCYVEEDSKAFTSIRNLIDIHRKYGAIPSYGLMGNPITEEEEDFDALVKTVKSYGIYAFDLFEFRTELKRAKEIVKTASYYGIPVFIGTEHNTKKLLPLTGEIGKDPDLHKYLRKSADFLCGHQLLSDVCGIGYLTPEGKPRFGDAKEGFLFFSRIGKLDLSEEKIEELRKKDLKERKIYFGC